MAGDVVPVVVDLCWWLVESKVTGRDRTYSVEESVVLDLGGTAGGVVDVVALHGDQVGVTVKVDGPVVVAIAGGGVVGDTVNVVVGERDAVVGAGSEDVVLATNAGGLSFVNLTLLI